MPASAYRQRYGSGKSPPMSAAQYQNRLTDGIGGYRRRRTYKRKAPTRRRYSRRYKRGNGMYVGTGGYMSDMWDAASGPILDAAQGALGMVPGIGSSLASGFSRIKPCLSGNASGQGSYVVKRNALINQGASDGAYDHSTFAAKSDLDTMVISHTDIISQIYAPPDDKYHTQSFALNPGLEKTFPWLAQVASCFKDYELLQCIFTYTPTLSDNLQTTTGVTGNVVMTPIYDTHEKPFSDYMSQTQAPGSNEPAKVTDHIEIGVECDPKKLNGSQTGKKVRSSGVPFGQDVINFDHGKVILGMNAFPEALYNQQIGFLRVTYTVRLRRPEHVSARGFAIGRDQHVLQSPTSVTTAGALNVIDIGAFAGALRDGGGQYNSTFSTTMWSNHKAFNFRNSMNVLDLKIEDPAISLEANLQEVPTPVGCDSFFTWVHGSNFAQQSILMYSAPVSHYWLTECPEVNSSCTMRPVRITFPAGASGNYTLKYTMTVSHRTCAGAVFVNSTGNVTPIEDMVSGFAAMDSGDMFATVPTDWRKLLTYAAAGASTCLKLSSCNLATQIEDLSVLRMPCGVTTHTVELHIKLQPATNGIDNTVDIYIAGNMVGGETGDVANLINAEVLCTEYNAGAVDEYGVPTLINVQSGERLGQPQL